jgi:hypothetical protein
MQIQGLLAVPQVGFCGNARVDFSGSQVVNVVETNQAYVVGAVMLSIGLAGMVASVVMGTFRYTRDKGLFYTKPGGV